MQKKQNNGNKFKKAKTSGVRRSPATQTKSISDSGKLGRDVNTGSYANDPNWYNLDPIITRDAASFPYSVPAGTKLFTENSWDPNSDESIVVPGIIAIEVAPSVGTAERVEDPVNIAAQQMYSFVTHANSRNTTYDAADMMQYFLATADCYSYIEYLKRIYGVARLFSYDNKYMPDAILSAMHVDPDDVRYHMADFRLGINMLINKVGTFAVPNSMSLFNRKQFMYSGIYSDGQSVKDQLYMFVPKAFYYWNWKENSLDCISFQDMHDKFLEEGLITIGTHRGAPYTINQLLEIGNYMVNSIMNNVDMGTMNGDILRAYGNNILTISPINEDYIVAPVVNIGVLEQMQNATIVNALDIDSLSINSSYVESGSQEGTSILVSKPQIDYSDVKVTTGAEYLDSSAKLALVSNLSGKHIIQTRVDNPDAPYNMEITRLTVGIVRTEINTVNPDGGGASVIIREDLIAGTEIVTDVNIISTKGIYPVNGCIAIPYTKGSYLEDDSYATFIDKIVDIIRIYDHIKSFQYAPTIYMYDLSKLRYLCNINGPAHIMASPLGADYATINTVHHTTLSNEDLSNMHKVAVMNEFYVPKVAVKAERK